MKRYGFINYLFFLFIVFLIAVSIAFYFYNQTLSYVFMAITVAFALTFIIYSRKGESKYNKLIKNLNDELGKASSNVLSSFTLPLIVVSDNDEIIWYNSAFYNEMSAEADSLIGMDLSVIVSKDDQIRLKKEKRVEVNYGGKVFRTFESLSNDGKISQRVICFLDITNLQKYAMEYMLSRPVVAVLAVDNFDDAAHGLRDSERSALHSKIQNVLENWFLKTNGLVQKLSGDRFLFIFEERYLNKIKADKFSILTEVKSIETSSGIKPTISIGIGVDANDFKGCAEYAKSALDMALGRGGDQAAIKIGENDYKFFGGVSSSTEKRSKVRTRIVASTLIDMLKSCDNILIMGHKFSDLDCVGAAFALQSAAERLEKEVSVVLDEHSTMAGPFIDRVYKLNKSINICPPQKALSKVGRGTLLFVLDTHRKNFVDAPELIDKCDNIVVIDHHRKAVDFIDKAVIFYHETSASSTCEMMTELLQYIDENSIERAEAEGLLAGIMLDTRNFVFNTGVRTFETSALLRKQGADPIEIKRLFADSLEFYKIKSNIIASAEIHKDSAVAFNTFEGAGTKIITGKAADELLEIKGVKTSYVLCRIDGKINISARTLSENVQIVMEKLSGGGSKTMAACELDTADFNVARDMLLKAIEEVRMD